MADIRPFRGTHYNQSRFKDLSAVICPPYDIISPQQQQELHLLSDYNFIRLEFARGTDIDEAANDIRDRVARVIAAASSPEKLEIARSSGADGPNRSDLECQNRWVPYLRSIPSSPFP